MTIPWGTIITTLVPLAVKIANAIRPSIDESRWESLGPEIASLVEKAIAGEDISHEELLKYIPDTLQMEILQAKKRAERIEQGLPV